MKISSPAEPVVVILQITAFLERAGALGSSIRPPSGGSKRGLPSSPL